MAPCQLCLYQRHHKHDADGSDAIYMTSLDVFVIECFTDAPSCMQFEDIKARSKMKEKSYDLLVIFFSQ